MRQLASQFIRVKVSNGRSTLFWLDQWLPLGRLIDIAGDTGPQRLGIGRYAKVADAVTETGWRFRRCRDPVLQHIISSVNNVPAPNVSTTDDMVMWRSGPDTYDCRFSSFKTWDQIRVHTAKQSWSKVIWFAKGVPRFAFIAWLAIRDRLATGARMEQWGLVQGCVFCGEPQETRDHLFFACPYTFTVWVAAVGDLLEASADPDWTDTLRRLVEHQFDRLTFILLRLVFQTTIYYLWKERNDRRHAGKQKSITQMNHLIDKTVRNRISSTRYFEKTKLRGLLQRWFKGH